MASVTETDESPALLAARASDPRSDAPRFRNPNGMPELWNTIAACFDDMLSAHSDLGRPPFHSTAQQPSFRTSRNAPSTESPNASTLSAPFDSGRDSLQDEMESCSKSSHDIPDLPPMPEPEVNSTTDASGKASKAGRVPRAKSNFVTTLFR